MLKQNITDEIKSYRLNQQHEQQLLQQVSTFDRLYINEQPIQTVPPESDPEAQQTSPMTDPLELPEDIMTEPVDCFNTSTSPITARIVLSKQLYYLWNTSSDLNHSTTLVRILKEYPNLLKTSLKCLIPYLTNRKIFNRVFKKINEGEFVPNIRFRTKIARLEDNRG